MAAEIKLTKPDESPWGFRLTGGRDFGTPLTIVKVAADSVAEQAGLQVGDILVKINDVDCPTLSHKEAQDLILLCKNAITFSVLRGSLNLSDEVIDRLTPLPLRELKTPDPLHPTRDVPPPSGEQPAAEVPSIEVIPIQDLEPELLEELGLNPLPEDFLERATRDPSPMPEVRPQSRMASPVDVLHALDDLGLQEMVLDIERQRDVVFSRPNTPKLVAAPVQLEGQSTAEQPPAEGLQATESTGADARNTSAAEVLPAEPTPVPAPVVPETVAVALDPIPVSAESGPTPEQIPNAQPISDAEFAEFISGQEEVLHAHGKDALGVDFKKYEPQAEFVRKSQVFKTLQDSEKVLTREEKDKRWTTFLDKPKGPKPKPRHKSQAKETPPQPQPEPEPVPAEPLPRTGLYEIPSQEEFEALVRIPTPPPKPEPENNETDTQQMEELANLQIELEKEQENLQNQLDVEKEQNPYCTSQEKSEIELQLEEIQKQLQAIQQLPFEIQQHLALVQQQLNEIVQNRLQESYEQEEVKETPPCPRPSMVDPEVLTSFAEVNETILEENEDLQNADVDLDVIEEQTEEPAKEEFKLRTKPQSPILPPAKKEKPRKKRPFLGLGPAPRPLILPGGRKWRTPKDAYNDEFIAETLSAQAEIITGTTLGVNFKRYEPRPTNLSHLRDSSVYKLIHDLEDPAVPNKGTAIRPEIVPALQDYTTLATVSSPAL